MKKRYFILAGMFMAAQVFASVPTLAEETADTAKEIVLEEDTEDPEEELEAAFTLSPDEENEGEEEAAEEPRPEYDFHDYLKELGNYKNLTAEVTPLESVTDEMVQDEINSRMTEITEEFTEGTVEEGDIANIDYVGKKDGVAFDGGTAEGADLEIGSHSFISGFEEGLVGVKIGDTVDLNLTFPEEYPAEDLAGAEVVFTVTVNSVRRVAEFSDEAASQLSDGVHNDMASYQAAVKEELELNNQEGQKAEAQNLFWSQVLETSVFESMPEEVIDYDMQKQLDYDKNILLLYYGTTLEDYCSSYGMKVEDYEAMVQENMENYLKYEIIGQAILEAEKLELSEETFEEYAEMYAKEYGYELEDFLEMEEPSSIWKMIYYDKASEILTNYNTYIEQTEE